MCPHGYHHSGSMATPALGTRDIYIYIYIYSPTSSFSVENITYVKEGLNFMQHILIVQLQPLLLLGFRFISCIKIVKVVFSINSLFRKETIVKCL